MTTLLSPVQNYKKLKAVRQLIANYEVKRNMLKFLNAEDDELQSKLLSEMECLLVRIMVVIEED